MKSLLAGEVITSLELTDPESEKLVTRDSKPLSSSRLLPTVCGGEGEKYLMSRCGGEGPLVW